MRRAGFRLLSIFGTAVVVTATVVAMSAPVSASAGTVRPGDRVPRGIAGTAGSRHAAAAATDPQLHYQGGPNGVIQGVPRVYIVYWGKQWGTANTDASGDLTFTGDKAGMAHYQQEFYKGVGTGGESWSAVMTQYCDGVAKGATSCPASNPEHIGLAVGTLAGVWYDNSVSAPSTASDNDIANEAVSAAQHFGN